MKKLIPLSLLIVLLAACAPRAVVVPATTIPFPTMTPGALVIGNLPTPVPRDELLANPATAVALASQPTATPDYSACPAGEDVISFVAIVEGGLSVVNAIPAFLNAGGSVDALRDGMADANLFGETGTLTDAHDFTGERTPEIMVSYTDPERGGTLLLLICENGRYVSRYQNTLGDTAPDILRVADLNADEVLDALVAAPVCSEVDSLCEYRVGIVSWDAFDGRFVNLLLTPPDGDLPPSSGDVDNDRVIEIVTVQEGRGTSETGPLRTGSQIYDWNGVAYVLSLSQPDPLRYVIQVIHEADRAFREDRTNDAARLYARARDAEDLAYWFGGDEADQLDAYVGYRLLLTFAYAENGDTLTIYEDLRETYNNFEDAPVYAILADAFWRQYQVTNNLNAGCEAVIQLVNERPLALELLNRYGTRSPSYTAETLCPF